MTNILSAIINGQTIQIDPQCLGQRLAPYNTNNDTVLDAQDGLTDRQIADHVAHEYGFEVSGQACTQRPWAAVFQSQMLLDLTALLQESRALIRDFQTFRTGLNLRQNMMQGVIEFEASDHYSYVEHKETMKSFRLKERMAHYVARLDQLTRYFHPLALSVEQDNPNSIVSSTRYIYIGDLPLAIQALVNQLLALNKQFRDLGQEAMSQEPNVMEFECDAPVFSTRFCDRGDETLSLTKHMLFVKKRSLPNAID